MKYIKETVRKGLLFEPPLKVVQRGCKQHQGNKSGCEVELLFGLPLHSSAKRVQTAPGKLGLIWEVTLLSGLPLKAVREGANNTWGFE